MSPAERKQALPHPHPTAKTSPRSSSEGAPPTTAMQCNLSQITFPVLLPVQQPSMAGRMRLAGRDRRYGQPRGPSTTPRRPSPLGAKRRERCRGCQRPRIIGQHLHRLALRANMLYTLFSAGGLVAARREVAALASSRGSAPSISPKSSSSRCLGARALWGFLGRPGSVRAAPGRVLLRPCRADGLSAVTAEAATPPAPPRPIFRRDYSPPPFTITSVRLRSGAPHLARAALSS